MVEVPSLLGPLERCHSAPATLRLAVASGILALIHGAEPRGGQGIGGHVSLPDAGAPGAAAEDTLPLMISLIAGTLRRVLPERRVSGLGEGRWSGG